MCVCIYLVDFSVCGVHYRCDFLSLTQPTIRHIFSFFPSFSFSLTLTTFSPSLTLSVSHSNHTPSLLSPFTFSIFFHSHTSSLSLCLTSRTPLLYYTQSLSGRCPNGGLLPPPSARIYCSPFSAERLGRVPVIELRKAVPECSTGDTHGGIEDISIFLTSATANRYLALGFESHIAALRVH
ncbi:unnamed protein product [Citrullus colocynthis]|uniref:Uncharacterized protein n=1 Tax=Citrullus colocynthis TaxID=252529 RepID=A0ABP0ZBK6_9ROSI